MNKNRTIVLAVIIAVILGLATWYVTSQNVAPGTSIATDNMQPAPEPMPSPTPTPDTTPMPTPAPTPTPDQTGSVKTFNVSAFNFGFAPKTITVNKGDVVKLVVTNTGGYHDLRIDEFNVATKRISDGQTDTVQFTADKTGSFEFYCSVGSHRAMGMWGTLTVK